MSTFKGHFEHALLYTFVMFFFLGGGGVVKMTMDYEYGLVFFCRLILSINNPSS